MKVAIVCANIGGIDEIHPPVKQDAAVDLFYYTENTLPFPLPHLNNRLKGKYFKTQAHRFLDHDVFIWIDASVEIISPDFVGQCIDKLRNSDVVINQHTQRENVYEEIEYIIEEMKGGSPYLLKRYAKEPFYHEYDFYKKSKMPKTIPLYQCSTFARWNNKKLNEAFNTWWDMILRYSNFDQTQFSYMVWKHELKINSFGEDLFIRHKHQ